MHQLGAKQTAAADWGVGYYHAGEVLLRKRPKVPEGRVDFNRIAEDLRSDVIIGHVAYGKSGALHTEDIHPFRFRQWLFAHVGRIDRFDALRERLLVSIPEFLRRNIRGDTDSEHLFHLVLAFLYDAGRLDDADIEPSVVAGALRSTAALLDRLVHEVGGDRSALNLAMTNGRVLLAAARGAPVVYTRRDGIRDCERCRPPSERGERVGKPVDHDAFRYVLVLAGDSPKLAGYDTLPDGHVLGVRRDLTIETSAL